MNMPTDIQERLSKALASIDSECARLVRRESVDIAEYPAPFLMRYRIYSVQYATPHKPIMFYIAYAPENPAYVLTGNPDNYSKLGRSAGVLINSDKSAAAYAITYLEVTRSMSSVQYVVQAVADVRFRPNLPEKEEQQRLAFIRAYGNIIKTPTVSRLPSAYSVGVFAVHGVELWRHDIEIGAEGQIKDDIQVVETRLPLLYGG
jgi:hypothetical protein